MKLSKLHEDLTTKQDEISDNKADEYSDFIVEAYDPDDLYYADHRSLTFIKAFGGELFYSRYPVTHSDMLEDEDTLKAVFGSQWKNLDLDDRRAECEYALFGRVSGNGMTIILWNSISNNELDDLVEAIRELIDNHYLKPEARLFAGNIRSATPIINLLHNKNIDTTKDRYSQAQLEKVHLMPPQLKKQVLGMVGGKRSPWQEPMQKLASQTNNPNLHHRPWRATSENRDRQ